MCSHLGYCRSALAVFKSTAPPRIRGLRATKRWKKVINAKTTLNKEQETWNKEPGTRAARRALEPWTAERSPRVIDTKTTTSLEHLER